MPELVGIGDILCGYRPGSVDQDWFDCPDGPLDIGSDTAGSEVFPPGGSEPCENGGELPGMNADGWLFALPGTAIGGEPMRRCDLVMGMSSSYGTGGG